MLINDITLLCLHDFLSTAYQSFRITDVSHVRSFAKNYGPSDCANDLKKKIGRIDHCETV